MIIVPDASVILKWVLEKEDEPSHAQALRLQEGNKTGTFTVSVREQDANAVTRRAASRAPRPT
jgi:hypothetical protein